jgi:hypothetical protein
VIEYNGWNWGVEERNPPPITYSQTPVAVPEAPEYTVGLGDKQAVALKGKVKFTGPGAALLANKTIIYLDFAETDPGTAYPPVRDGQTEIRGYFSNSVWEGDFEVIVKNGEPLWTAIDFGGAYTYMPLETRLPRNVSGNFYLTKSSGANFALDTNTIELPLVKLSGTVDFSSPLPAGWSSAGIRTQVQLYADPGRTVFVAASPERAGGAWEINLPPQLSQTLYPVALVSNLVDQTAPDPAAALTVSDWQRYIPAETISYGNGDSTAALTLAMTSAPVKVNLTGSVDFTGLRGAAAAAAYVSVYADAALSCRAGMGAEVSPLNGNNGEWTIGEVYVTPGTTLWIDLQVTLENGLTIHQTRTWDVPGTISGGGPVGTGNLTFEPIGSGDHPRISGSDGEDRFLLTVATGGTYSIHAKIPAASGGGPVIPRWLGIDPEITLYGKDGGILAENSDFKDADGRYTNNACIRYNLEANTPYFVSVGNYYSYAGANAYVFKLEN